METQELKKCYYALSDDIRLKILRFLIEFEELCVCQLQEIFDISQPNLSFHLRILRDADFVKTKRKSKWVFYFLNLDNPILKANLKFIKQIEIDKNINFQCQI
ncbi:ArsR/SmtB family transcription factor [Hydrogenothermus marinus]|uniref:ArsR family transcriptional regulator n=1 Tax=Hydrogenothermus marinus TaxID=133270 RepID=A0A3M0BA99_9AQUI|nr:metalloregulator ArsR/SmtB family transcription factor [Hydrogenothermus marinus]RMA93089.1 ArsR family transcriptional regulator [Hydrogenothermus marinus]